MHFTEKSSIIDTCKQSYANDISNGGLSSSDVASYCNDSWNNMTYVRSLSRPLTNRSLLLTLPYSPSLPQFDIALLIFSIFLSFFFASLAASFLYQLQNVRLAKSPSASKRDKLTRTLCSPKPSARTP